MSDVRTGLMWMKCVIGRTGNDCASGAAQAYTWKGALTLIAANNGTSAWSVPYTDWRLPNIKELASIVEVRCFDPAINPTLYPATPSLGFWSATPDAEYPVNAYMIHMYHGDEYRYPKSQSLLLRLVRGP